MRTWFDGWASSLTLLKSASRRLTAATLDIVSHKRISQHTCASALRGVCLTSDCYVDAAASWRSPQLHAVETTSPPARAASTYLIRILEDSSLNTQAIKERCYTRNYCRNTRRQPASNNDCALLGYYAAISGNYFTDVSGKPIGPVVGCQKLPLLAA